MGFGFGKKKKNISSDTTPAAADIKTTLDEDGNVEIVSKNFKMKRHKSWRSNHPVKGTLGSAGDADSLRIRISVLSAVRNAQSNNSHTQGAVKKLD